MKNQVTIPEVRDALELTKKILPIMNKEEYLEYMLLLNGVLNRYGAEDHQMKVEENQ